MFSRFLTSCFFFVRIIQLCEPERRNLGRTTLIVNGLAVLCLIFAFVKDREKAKRSVFKALMAFLRMLPVIIGIVIFIGILLGFVSKEVIERIVGVRGGIIGVVLVGLFGAVLHIPSLIAFPLAASLLKSGATVTSVAVFITTLTMIGFVTLPLEIRELGRKMALLRNGISFIIALIIGVIMGLLL